MALGLAVDHQSTLGDPSDLLAMPSREWAISSLVAGFPIEQLITILDHAERAAFEKFNLPRLLSLRLLKQRASNGPAFQTDQWPLFQEVAVSLSDDPNVEILLRTELHRAQAGVIPFIVRNADESTRAHLAREAIAELNRRITRPRDNWTESSDQQSELAHAIAAVVANTKTEHTRRLVTFAKRAADADA